MKIETVLPRDLDRLRPLWLSKLAGLRLSQQSAGPFLEDSASWDARRETYSTAFAEGAVGFVAHLKTGEQGYLIAARRSMDWTATFALEPYLWEVLTLHVPTSAIGEAAAIELLRRVESLAAASAYPTVLIGSLAGEPVVDSFYRARHFPPVWLTLVRFDRIISRPEATPSNIRRHAAGDVDRLKKLWLMLHHYHQTSAPALGPFVTDDESWVAIRKLWIKSAEEGLLFVAWNDTDPVGLASVAIHRRDVMPALSDIWATQERIGETKFLVVDASVRGKGVGTALMDEVDREFARRDVGDHMIGAIWGNEAAIDFYTGRGFRPGWIEYIKKVN
jgi:GNAT superfamily N-acetyltransferase